MTMTMTELKDMSDEEIIELIKSKLNSPVETFHDAIILLDELDKIVEGR